MLSFLDSLKEKKRLNRCGFKCGWSGNVGFCHLKVYMCTEHDLKVGVELESKDNGNAVPNLQDIKIHSK